LKETDAPRSQEEISSDVGYDGFTGVVKMLIYTSRVALTPTDIRDFVKLSKIEGSDSENILKHVHGVIARLRKQSFIEEVAGSGGKPANVWNRALGGIREFDPTPPDEVDQFRRRFNLANFESAVDYPAINPEAFNKRLADAMLVAPKPSRAPAARGSVAEKLFAQQDAKKRK
jgi:hypothetical protein